MPRCVGAACAAAACVILAACTTFSEPPTEIDPDDVARYGANQQRYLEEFADAAGVGPGLPIEGAPEWNMVIREGMNFSDTRCRRFLAKISDARNKKDMATKQLALVGSSATTILGITDTAQKTMALVAEAFGLASGTLANLTSSVLFQAEPSGVKRSVENLQAGYREVVYRSDYRTRSAAVKVVGDYYSICLPVNIEAELNQKIDNKGSVVTKGTGIEATPIIAAPGDIATIKWSYSTNDAQDALEGILVDVKSGTFKPVAVAGLRGCIIDLKLPDTTNVPKILYDEPYHARHMDIVACMKGRGF